jgi:hydroxyethylthiazole kinase-like sugar kinase family protein
MVEKCAEDNDARRCTCEMVVHETLDCVKGRVGEIRELLVIREVCYF